jgi:glycosyltransferase involved in cell wall biosynthesis
VTLAAGADDAATPRVSVVIVSWCRPDHVRSCLEHLAKVTPPPHEVVVVDASPDDRTAAVVRDFPGVLHVAFPGGAGHMTTSRNVGLLRVSGDILAFIDDDVNVRPGWRPSRDIRRSEHWCRRRPDLQRTAGGGVQWC